MSSAHRPHVIRMLSARDFSSQIISSQRADSSAKNQVVHKHMFKDPQVAHARLAQKGECWTLNQR